MAMKLYAVELSIRGRFLRERVWPGDDELVDIETAEQRFGSVLKELERGGNVDDVEAKSVTAAHLVCVEFTGGEEGQPLTEAGRRDVETRRKAWGWKSGSQQAQRRAA